METKKKGIWEYQKYEPINDIFVVKYKKPLEKYSKGYMFELRLADATGEINAKYWGPDDKEKVSLIYQDITKGTVIKAEGNIKEYKNKPELNLTSIKLIGENEYDLSAFIKTSQKDPEKTFEKITLAISSVKNPDCKKLLNSFFEDDNFSKRFKRHTAAIYIHHNTIGGLLEHTTNVLELCQKLCELYPSLDRDLIITGALLHDIGKLEELDFKAGIYATEKGRLIGHLILSYEMVSKKIEELNIEGTLKNKILHMILAHHGKKENGSPKEPMFPEAMCIYLADDMDATLAQMLSLKETAFTDDDFIYSKEFGNIFLR